MPNPQLHGQSFVKTSSGTASAIATFSGTTLSLAYITDVSGTSSTAGTWAIFGGTTGTTVLWAGTGNISCQFSQPLTGSPTANMSFVMNGTVTTYANITGYYLQTSG